MVNEINGVGGNFGKIFLKIFIKYVALSVTVVFLRAFKVSCINESQVEGIKLHK